MSNEVRASEPVDTAAAILPCLLAWLVPGLGHFYLGRRARAAVFFAIVVVLYLAGVSLDGRVYLADSEEPLTYFALVANVGAGPLDLWGRFRVYDGITYFMPPKNRHDERETMVRKTRTRVYSSTYGYGTTYILTSGLMNLLLMLDVFDISAGRKR